VKVTHACSIKRVHIHRCVSHSAYLHCSSTVRLLCTTERVTWLLLAHLSPPFTSCHLFRSYFVVYHWESDIASIGTSQSPFHFFPPIPLLLCCVPLREWHRTSQSPFHFLPPIPLLLCCVPLREWHRTSQSPFHFLPPILLLLSAFSLPFPTLPCLLCLSTPFVFPECYSSLLLLSMQVLHSVVRTFVWKSSVVYVHCLVIIHPVTHCILFSVLSCSLDHGYLIMYNRLYCAANLPQ